MILPRDNENTWAISTLMDVVPVTLQLRAIEVERFEDKVVLADESSL